MLDHASTTPIDPGVLRVMNEVMAGNYANPGGIHAEGVRAARKLAESRAQVAILLGTTSDHIVFTRGGTESDNLAIVGTLATTPQSLVSLGTAPLIKGSHLNSGVPHVIVSAIEHAAVPWRSK